MTVPGDSSRSTANRLLATLPPEQYGALRPQLEPVAFGVKDVVYRPTEPIPYVVFPNTGVFSLLSLMADGRAVEVATVGNEGMVGLPVLLGCDSTPGMGFAQSLRMPAAAFKAAVARDGAFAAVLHRYVQALVTQLAQSSACNCLHSAEARGARWLLMTHDRVDADAFPLTHEFLAQMLGVRRETVTLGLGALQRAGLIRYRHGVITVEDRAGLEAASCECYRVIRDEFRRLVG